MMFLSFIQVLLVLVFVLLLFWQGLILVAIKTAVQTSKIHAPLFWLLVSIGNILFVLIAILCIFFIIIAENPALLERG